MYNYLKREMWDGFSLYEKLFMWGMVLLQIIVYIIAPDSWYGVYYLTLIRQYRYPIDDYLYELPAGLTESGESLEDTAKRELKEETGLELLVTEVTPPFFSSAGMTDESCAIVYGACLGEPSLKGQERAEDIEVIFADAEECKRILQKEKVCMRTAMVIRQFLMCKWTTAFKEKE